MKVPTILAFAAVAIVVCTMLSACGSDQPSESNHVVVVSRDLGINHLGIEASHLSEKPNPKGEGTFVYAFEGPHHFSFRGRSHRCMYYALSLWLRPAQVGYGEGQYG